MSSFEIKARNKDTKYIADVFCYDDYFGKHQYGYIASDRDGVVLTESQFEKLYIRVK